MQLNGPFGNESDGMSKTFCTYSGMKMTSCLNVTNTVVQGVLHKTHKYLYLVVSYIHTHVWSGGGLDSLQRYSFSTMCKDTHYWQYAKMFFFNTTSKDAHYVVTPTEEQKGKNEKFCIPFHLSCRVALKRASWSVLWYMEYPNQRDVTGHGKKASQVLVCLLLASFWCRGVTNSVPTYC